jgi:hypothetical protein
MKLLIALILAAAASFGQDQSKVEFGVTLANGTKLVESISGPPAAAGIETVSLWMATQTECKTVAEVPAETDADGNVTKPGKPAGQECKPRYNSVADALKHMVVNSALALAQQFPSKALQPDIVELRQKMAAIEAKRKALAEAALAQ